MSDFRNHRLLEGQDLAAVLSAAGQVAASPGDAVYTLMADESVRIELVQANGSLRLVSHLSAALVSILGDLGTDENGALTFAGELIGRVIDAGPQPVTIEITAPLSFISIDEGEPLSSAVQGEAIASDGSEVERVITYALDGLAVSEISVGEPEQLLTGTGFFRVGDVTTPVVPLGPVTIAAVLDPVVPVITYEPGPAIGALGSVVDGTTVASILAALDEGAATRVPSGTVSISRALIVNGVEASGTVVTGDVITEARFTATAEGAAPVTKTLPLNITVVAVAIPETATIAHKGATFTVTNVTQQGTFADGDPWVVVADGGQITQVAPVSTVVAERTITEGGVSTNTVAHGMQRNPGNAAEVYTDVGTLAKKQVKNWTHSGGGSYGTHGYDGSQLWSINPVYDPALNLDPGATGQPLAAKVGTYVKAISPLSDLGKRPTLLSFGVLHVLPAPPAADALAPPIQTADKTIRVRKSEIDPTIFNNYPAPAGLPTATQMKALLDWAHTWQKTYGTNTENIVPVPIPNNYGQDGFKVSSYMGTTHQCYAQAALALETDHWTLAEKHDIATLLVAHAVDAIGRALEGGIIQDNGGWSGGGALTLWAAKITGNQWLMDGALMRAEADIGFANKLTKVGESVWGEWKQHRYITQADIDADHTINAVVSGVTYTDEYFFTQRMLGWPEWNGDATRERKMHNSLGIQKAWPESYRDINAKSDVPFVLALRMRGVKLGDAPDADPTIAYVDRHMQWLLGDDTYDGIDLTNVIVRSPGGRTDLRNNSTNPITAMVRTLWTAYRGTEDLWTVDGVTPEEPEVPAGTGTLVTAVIGQSVNEIAFAINTVFYTGGPYPALLSGVDAKIAIQAASDKSGADTIRTLNQTAINAKDVNPGFVALANLWHVGSGGRPLRLVDVCVPGTNADDMLDSENTKRNTAADLAIIQFAQASFGPVQRVTLNWTGNEAYVSKTLRRDRSPHFIGRNEDGTPYEFVQPGIDYCVIDTTGRGYGMFPDTAKFDVMMQLLTVETAENLYNPPHRNYRYGSTGADLIGRINQNGAPMIEERKLFIDSIPLANRGVPTITSGPVRFGDYQNGVKLPGSSQTSIHPAMQSLDGQALFAQHVAASFLISEGHLKVSKHLRTEVAGDGSYADLVFNMANGGTLTTMRKTGRGSPITTPRPHQHADGMGFVIYRTGDDRRTGKPLFRADQTDSTRYPLAYRGTVEIIDTGTNRNGVREARVRVTPVQPFKDGEVLLFGDDGGYGAFILHGHPDYDAKLYLDCLIEHIPALATAGYPGIPIEPQVTTTLSGINGEAPPPDPSTATGIEMFDFSVAPTTNSTGMTKSGTTYSGKAKTTGAGLRITWPTIAPQAQYRKLVLAKARVTVDQQTVFGLKMSAVQFLTSNVSAYETTLTPTTPGVPQTFDVEGFIDGPRNADFGGFQFYATTTEGNISIDMNTVSFLDLDNATTDEQPDGPAAPDPEVSNAYFEFTGSGPTIVDPNPIGTGKFKLRGQFEMYVPTGAAVGAKKFLAQLSTGCDFRFLNNGAIGVLAIEDNRADTTQNLVLSSRELLPVPVNTRFIFDFTINMQANTLFYSSDLPGADVTLPFDKASTGEFQGGRPFSLFGSNTLTDLLPAGVRCYRARLWFNDSATPYVDVDATTINAHPWKQGTNAVIVNG